MKFKGKMTPKDQEEARILKKFPFIFAQNGSPLTETAMCWGLDIGYGWMWLIERLCEKIQSTVDYYHLPPLEATQVKQKYGLLRFYYTWGEPDPRCELIEKELSEKMNEVEAYIEFACDLSYSICEECGTTYGVTQNDNGWISTLCDKCRKEK